MSLTLALLSQQIAFDAACNYGEKADILRYEILERHGGVYADVDVACLRSFDRLLEVSLALRVTSCCSVGGRGDARPNLRRLVCLSQTFSFAAGIANTGCVEISNSVIVAAPRHPILQRLIEVIEQKFKQPRLDDNALMRIAQMSGDLTLIKSLSKKENGPDAPMLTIARTGPGLLTKTFMAAVGWTGRNGAVEGFLVSDRHRDGVIALPIEFLSPLPNDVNATATAAPTSDSAVAVFPTVPMAVHYWSRTWIRS